MKQLFMFILLLVVSIVAVAQQVIRLKDPYITAQEERMVATRWGNWLPRPKYILGVQTNVHYMNTWGWLAPKDSRDYKDGADIRPLGPTGQQTQRMILNEGLLNISNDYRMKSDSMAKTAKSELINNSGLFSGLDPLWVLYYKQELKYVTDYDRQSTLASLSANELNYLQQNGTIDWFDSEMSRMQERLKGAHNTDMDKGSRIMAYHRILIQYRQVFSKWNTHLNLAEQVLSLKNYHAKSKDINSTSANFGSWDSSSDFKIMESILLKTNKK